MMGRKFQLLDNWTDEKQAHRVLVFSLRGKATFWTQDGMYLNQDDRGSFELQQTDRGQHQQQHTQQHTTHDCGDDTKALLSLGPAVKTGRWADECVQ